MKTPMYGDVYTANFERHGTYQIVVLKDGTGHFCSNPRDAETYTRTTTTPMFELEGNIDKYLYNIFGVIWEDK